MKILIIGNRGYVGSLLESHLKTNENYFVEGLDLCLFNHPTNETVLIDYNQVNQNYLKFYDVVILLAGHSSVKMCEGDIIYPYNNNVRNFINLVSKLNKGVKFIYASSSSVYGKCKDVADETNMDFIPYNNYDVTKHMIDLYIERTDVEYYGLRFGTVNGYSPLLRKDLMINSMYCNSIENGQINLFIKNIMRPILGVNDLVNAIGKIIESNEDKRGLYNLASFNKTAEQIAYKVGDILNKPVVEIDANPKEIINSKLQTVCYDFGIDTSKFQKEFDFKFTDTIDSIVESLQKNTYIESSRDKQYRYEEL